jgi:hypothetical protein
VLLVDGPKFSPGSVSLLVFFGIPLFFSPLGTALFPSCGLSFSGFYSQRTMSFHPLITGVMVAVGG